MRDEAVKVARGIVSYIREYVPKRRCPGPSRRKDQQLLAARVKTGSHCLSLTLSQTLRGSERLIG